MFWLISSSIVLSVLDFLLHSVCQHRSSVFQVCELRNWHNGSKYPGSARLSDWPTSARQGESSTDSASASANVNWHLGRYTLEALHNSPTYTSMFLVQVITSNSFPGFVGSQVDFTVGRAHPERHNCFTRHPVYNSKSRQTEDCTHVVQELLLTLPQNFKSVSQIKVTRMSNSH